MKKQIYERFQTKDLGTVKFFLSMLVEHEREPQTIFLSPETYLAIIVHRFSMYNCKASSTLLDPKTKLNLRTEVKESTKIHTYQNAVRSVIYAAIITRPDLLYATGLVGHFTSNPSTIHWQAVNRIQRYVRVTKGYQLLLGAGKAVISSEQSTIQ